MSTIAAVFENGIFRPENPVHLAEGTRVQLVLTEPAATFGVEAQATAEQIAARRRVYEILSRRYDSGHHDTAERHNEHQP